LIVGSSESNAVLSSREFLGGLVEDLEKVLLEVDAGLASSLFDRSGGGNGFGWIVSFLVARESDRF
jgi:hypothetical protein